MNDKIWYNRYVKDWLHALPLGNGRIGAMVFGDPDQEVIGVNEESLWSGTPAPEQYATTREDLAELRLLIAGERLAEASDLFARAFTSDPMRVRHYETFGQISIDFADKTPYTDYYKELDLRRGVVTVSWRKGSSAFRSESFVSEAGDVFVYKVSSDKPFSCKVRMDRAQDAYSAALSPDTLILNGRITYCDDPMHGKGAEGMSFGGRLKLFTDGESIPEHSALAVKDATCVVLYGAFSTNYDVSSFTIDEAKDYRKELSDRLESLSQADYDTMYEGHCRSHEQSFSSVHLHLDGEDYSGFSTDERLRRVREENVFDPGLYVLYYHYGRYLLTESAGKNATLPANLQGIWNWEFRPAWGSDYHTNVNLQMNYWPAEVWGCSETLRALTHFVQMLRKFGSRTAKEIFGARGWEINVSTDIFGHVGIHGKVGQGCYPTAAAWMCLPLWEHYEYTGDDSYLEEIYPILYEACLFLCDFLTESEDGTLIAHIVQTGICRIKGLFIAFDLVIHDFQITVIVTHFGVFTPLRLCLGQFVAVRIHGEGIGSVFHNIFVKIFGTLCRIASFPLDTRAILWYFSVKGRPLIEWRFVTPTFGGLYFFCQFFIVAKITSPSNSPENTFLYQEPDGTAGKCMLTQGTTMDYQIIYALFLRMIHACTALNRNADFAEQLKNMLNRLPPLRVSKRYGTLCEWYKDYEEDEPGHRHISHLFGLYPSDQINETDPEIYEAAKRTITRRLRYGGGQTGWSRAWIVNFYARFKDGNEALAHLDELLKTSTAQNLFNLHPPHIFQIDGNLGAAAGINEMLIQSHLGAAGSRVVELLPALPRRWESGSVCGLRARGNMIFDFAWKHGRVTGASVTAPKGGTLRLKLPSGALPLQASIPYTVEDSILQCDFGENDTLQLQFCE